MRISPSAELIVALSLNARLMLWRYADVIDHHFEIGGRNDFANHVFDGGENLFGFLEARAGRRVDMQTELARIDSREEIATDPSAESTNALPTRSAKRTKMVTRFCSDHASAST